MAFVLGELALSLYQPEDGFNNNDYVTISGIVDKIEETAYGFNYFIKSDFSYICSSFSTHNLEYGNEVIIRGVYKEFQNSRNKGNFDEKWYYNSIGYSGRVEIKKIEVLDHSVDNIKIFLSDASEKIRKSIYSICNEGDASIFDAMLLGNKKGIDSEVKKLFSDSGISHILVISGLHISMIGMCIYNILRKFTKTLSASMVTIIVIILFGIMSGEGVSARRAIIMLIIRLGAEISGRTYDMISAIACAGILMLMDNGLLLMNSGFQMSFASVAGIGIFYNPIKDFLAVNSRIGKSLLASTVITMVNLPLIAYNYCEIPTYSILLNIVVIPLMGIVLVSGGMGAFIGIISNFAGKISIGTGCFIIRFYEEICKINEKMPFNSIRTGQPPLINIVIYYVILVVFCLMCLRFKNKINDIEIWQKRYGKRAIGIAVMLCIVFVLLSKKSNDFMITFIDVGQGDGIFMRENDTTYLIDGGSTDVSQVGKYRIIPYLKSEAVSKIDYAIMTHADNDHINGLKEILNGDDIKIKTLVMPVTNLVDDAYNEIVKLAEDAGTEVIYICAGDVIASGMDFSITCIHPDSDFIAVDRNDYSTVLKVCYKEFEILLTGDVTESGERSMLEYVKKEDYDVIKVAHHGSKYSTTEDFIDLIKPEYAIISCGEDNSYGHPHDELINRLTDKNIDISLTKDCGAITFTVNNNSIKMEKYCCD